MVFRCNRREADELRLEAADAGMVRLPETSAVAHACISGEERRLLKSSYLVVSKIGERSMDNKSLLYPVQIALCETRSCPNGTKPLLAQNFSLNLFWAAPKCR